MKLRLRVWRAVKSSCSRGVIHRAGGAAHIDIMLGIQTKVQNTSVGREGCTRVEIIARCSAQMR